jgi:hypothetical protein
MVKARSRNKVIPNLATHPAAYVTPAELARYWRIPPAELLEHIQTGSLKALRFGARLFRIRTKDAIEFERRIRMSAGPPRTASNPSKKDTFN